METQGWFAVAVLSYNEAKDRIAEIGFPVFCPMERKFKRWRGRKVPTDKPLFPGYLFANFDRTKPGWGAIDKADGVLGILRSGTLPIMVPDDDIERLKMAEAIGAFDRTQPPKVGLAVEAAEGPFAGWIGKIVRARSSERVDVLLNFLGGMVEVNMPIASLREV